MIQAKWKGKRRKQVKSKIRKILGKKISKKK